MHTPLNYHALLRHHLQGRYKLGLIDVPEDEIKRLRLLLVIPAKKSSHTAITIIIISTPLILLNRIAEMEWRRAKRPRTIITSESQAAGQES